MIFFIEEPNPTFLGIPAETRAAIFKNINVWDLINVAYTCKTLKKEAIQTFKRIHTNNQIEIIQYQRQMYTKRKFKLGFYYLYYKNSQHARGI